MRIVPRTHGVSFECDDVRQGFELISLASDPKYGHWVLLKAAKQEVEIRVTKSGQLRVSTIRKAGELRAEPRTS